MAKLPNYFITSDNNVFFQVPRDFYCEGVLEGACIIFIWVTLKLIWGEIQI